MKNKIEFLRSYVESFNKDDISNLHSSDLNSLYSLAQNSVPFTLYDINSNGRIIKLSLENINSLPYGAYFLELQELKIFDSKITESVIEFINKHSTLKEISFFRCVFVKNPRFSNLLNLTFLHLSRIGISSFKELSFVKALYNLEELIINHTQITSLQGCEFLEASHNLKSLELSHNRISDLCELQPISSLQNLEYLNLSYNKVRELHITHNIPKLKIIYLFDNRIKRIVAVKNLTALEKLDLSHNKLTSLDFNTFENLPNLSELSIDNNWLFSLHLKNSTNIPMLSKISIDENPIKFITGLEKFPNPLEIKFLTPDIFSHAEYDALESYLLSIGYACSEGCVYKPPPPQAEFKINKFLTLKLEKGNSNIYVNQRFFEHCKFLLLTIPIDEIQYLDEIESIDEIAEKLDKSAEKYKIPVPPETVFWAHASNLQVWVESGYNTNLLHYNLAFPLLKRLKEAGDPYAKKVFKEEIAKRYSSGFPPVVQFLENGGYLKYLFKEELESFENI